MNKITDERLAELIADAIEQEHSSQDSPHFEALSRDTAAALRELHLRRANFASLTDAQRIEHVNALLSGYCKSCGRADPGCQCWNDE